MAARLRRALLLDRERLSRAEPDRLLDLLAVLLAGALDQDVELVIVVHLEDLGRDLHAHGIGLT